MDIESVIQKLQRERARLDEIITSFEQLQQSVAVAVKKVPQRRGRKFMSAEERQQVSARMKRYWESRRTSVLAKTAGMEG